MDLTRYLSLGTRGDDVLAWQQVLGLAGYNVVTDGQFGDETLQATRAFQQSLGVEADGVVGPVTFAAAAARYPEIRAMFEAVPGTWSGRGTFLLWGLMAVGTLFLLSKLGKKPGGR